MHKSGYYVYTGCKCPPVSSEDKGKKLSCIAVLALMMVIGNNGERNQSAANFKS